MANRKSFKDEDIIHVANKHCDTDATTYKLIASKRGSAALVATMTGDYIVKYADKRNIETESHITPSRSIGIENEVATMLSLEKLIPGRLHAYDSNDRHAYSVMRFIPGMSLDRYNGDPRILPAILISLIKNIELLHQNRVIHGDITPNNIIVSESGLQLIDFELSHTLDSPGIAPGLCHFLSPEAARSILADRQPVLDTKEETYALASTCLSILTGQLPSTYSQASPSRIAVLTEIAAGTSTFISDGCDESNQHLAESLMTILRLPLADRPESPTALYEALEWQS